MNTAASEHSVIVTSQLVPAERRHLCLPKHFGPLMRTVEFGVYDFMQHLSADYTAAYWHYYELSNGGFYMAPAVEKLRVRVHGNHFDDLLSADAAGITACLFTFSHLSFQMRGDMAALHFHLLRAFAAEHAEAGRILAAID